jgi:hypothetical protein
MAETCFICSKVVYLPERVKALERTWHKTCFKCGAGSDIENDCCGKILNPLEGYSQSKNLPYCKTCYTKNFGPVGIHKGLSTSLAPPVKPMSYLSEDADRTAKQDDNLTAALGRLKKTGVIAEKRTSVSEGIGGLMSKFEKANEAQAQDGESEKMPSVAQRRASFQNEVQAQDGGSEKPPSVAQRRASFQKSTPETIATGLKPVGEGKAIANEQAKGIAKKLGASGTSPKCVVCAKTVYKVEEVKALNKIYHKSCFRCGQGTQAIGKDSGACNKVLSIMESYLEHESTPYCKNCHVKLFASVGTRTGAKYVSAVDQNVSSFTKVDATKEIETVMSQALETATLGESTTTTTPAAPVTKPDTLEVLGKMSTMSDEKKATRRASGNGLVNTKVGGSALERVELHAEAEYAGDGDEVDEDEWA